MSQVLTHFESEVIHIRASEIVRDSLIRGAARLLSIPSFREAACEALQMPASASLSQLLTRAEDLVKLSLEHRGAWWWEFEHHIKLREWETAIRLAYGLPATKEEENEKA